MAGSILHASGIYQILNTHNGKMYVGSAINIPARWRAHLSHLRNGKHHSAHLQSSWNRHGESVFSFSVLQAVNDATHLLQCEDEWIGKLKSADRSHGYNICPKAGSQLGMRHSTEAREKMSIAHAGKPKTAEHQRAINDALKGRKLSTECKQKLSAARTGTSMSENARAKMSESRKGKTATPEARAKISAAITARHAAARAAGITLSGKPLKQSLHEERRSVATPSVEE